jgi:hypothetical protein
VTRTSTRRRRRAILVRNFERADDGGCRRNNRFAGCCDLRRSAFKNRHHPGVVDVAHASVGIDRERVEAVIDGNFEDNAEHFAGQHALLARTQPIVGERANATFFVFILRDLAHIGHRGAGAEPLLTVLILEQCRIVAEQHIVNVVHFRRPVRRRVVHGLSRQTQHAAEADQRRKRSKHGRYLSRSARA